VSLSIGLSTARPACAESVRALLRAVEGMNELELLDASRCRGWTRLDVVVHLVGGWHEMLGGLVSPVDAPSTVDSASYWTAFAGDQDDDPVATLMAQRRRTAAYARPAAAVEQLRDVGAAVLRGIGAMPDRRCLWQGHVFEPGDFLTVWAVEHVVHHLDLRSEEQPPADGLQLARRTVEALVSDPLPASWSDTTATLVGTGREAVPGPFPDGAAHLASRLPVL
jgi:uncharacterized protein (TIGR03083 family)